MKKFPSYAFAVFVTLWISSLASASEDMGIYSDFESDPENFFNVDFISPQQDYRQNLKFLVNAYFFNQVSHTERHFPESDSIKDTLPCRTNNRPTVNLFRAAVDATNTGPEIKSALIALREDLNSDCGKPGIPIATVTDQCRALQSKSSEATWFCNYLGGVGELYYGDSEKALHEFEKGRNAPNEWIKETSEYLSGRVALIAAQKYANPYQVPPIPVNHTLVDIAKSYFQEYIRRYPQGLYTDSAKGLIRRALHFNDENTEALHLVEESLVASAKSKDHYSVLDRIGEMEIIGFSGVAFRQDTPLIGSIRALQNLKYDLSTFPSAADIDSLKIDDLQYPGLRNLLYGYLLLRDKKPLDALVQVEQTPRDCPQVVQDSILRVKALAFEDAGRGAEAKAVWWQLLQKDEYKKSVRSDLILHNIRFKTVEELFLGRYSLPFDTEEDDGFLFASILGRYGKEKLLIDIENDKSLDEHIRLIADNLLLQKYLLERSFNKFVDIYAGSEGQNKIQYREVVDAARKLTTDPKHLPSLLEIISFLHTHGLYKLQRNTYFKYDTQENLVWDVPETVPLLEYRRILAEIEKNKGWNNTDLEARVLSILINCFASNDFGSSCRYAPHPLEQEELNIPKEVRKKWFKLLKTKHKNTMWAKETKSWY